jgi:hypothetical protein
MYNDGHINVENSNHTNNLISKLIPENPKIICTFLKVSYRHMEIT